MAATLRHIYMVLSPRALPYAHLALESLLRNSSEALDLHLITDSDTDRQILNDALAALEPGPRHHWNVTAESELLDRESDLFGRYANLRAFRRGHPSWRKVTVPLLLVDPA